jgi:periplasmic protein TonB
MRRVPRPAGEALRGLTARIAPAPNGKLMNRSRAMGADIVESPGDAAPEFDQTNVVPFARRDGTSARSAPTISVKPADRPMGSFAPRRARLVALIICSAAAHVALYLPFGQEPEPMASLDEQVISAEIVLGTTREAGLTNRDGDAPLSAPEPARTAEPAVEEPKPAEPEPETRRIETASVEPAKERPHEVKPPQPQQAAALPEPDTQPTVMLQAPVEPVPDQPAAPAQIQAIPETPTAPAELQASINPDPAPETKVAPEPEARRVPEVSAKPAPPRETAKPQPKKPEKPQETRRANLAGAPNDQRSTAPAAVAAGGAGRGRSDASSNYPGLVSAHLRRFQQYPSDARSRGDQGRATVTFSLGGGGGVTSVKLTRGTGFASLDAEATAMVRRASPFPAPPDGRPQSFTVPIGFRLN